MRKVLAALAALLVLVTAMPVYAQSSIPVASNGLATLTDGQATSLRTDLFGRLYVNVSNSVGLTPPIPNATSFPAVKTSAVGGSLVIAASGNPTLLVLDVVSGASAGFVMVFPGAAVPADGAVTPTECYTIAANSTFVRPYNPSTWFSGGVVAVFSTTGCFSKTISATAFISATVSP